MEKEWCIEERGGGVWLICVLAFHTALLLLRPYAIIDFRALITMWSRNFPPKFISALEYAYLLRGYSFIVFSFYFLIITSILGQDFNYITVIVF